LLFIVAAPASLVGGTKIKKISFSYGAETHGGNGPVSASSQRPSHCLVTTPRITMPPPGKLEVFIFWTVGIVVAILSGAVAIYASHLHLWDVH
jgi:hypothetical protein